MSCAQSELLTYNGGVCRSRRLVCLTVRFGDAKSDIADAPCPVSGGFGALQCGIDDGDGEGGEAGVHHAPCLPPPPPAEAEVVHKAVAGLASHTAANRRTCAPLRSVTLVETCLCLLRTATPSRSRGLRCKSLVSPATRPAPLRRASLLRRAKHSIFSAARMRKSLAPPASQNIRAREWPSRYDKPARSTRPAARDRIRQASQLLASLALVSAPRPSRAVRPLLAIRDE